MAQISVRSKKSDFSKVQGPTVTITVGATKSPFHIHKSLICTSSLFFQKAMSGPWKESKEQTLELPEDNPQAFALYSHWLYFGKFPVIDEGNNHSKEYYDLVNAYVLGGKLLDVKFQNSAIDAIVEKSSAPDPHDGKRYYPFGALISHAYNSTTESATIRKLFVDMHVDAAEAGWLNRELPKEFLYSVVEGFMKKRTAQAKKIKAFDYYVNPSTN
ncbi:hypothetical protein PENFLA_c012G04784 [Penicillium flavigenum]|uniref:BTB domain-containing protein n=1 Tax=Penicillium flavigenum TaxID=254877 RepID=A0A1V6T8H5_9EURO|nr:hypothetical protein PENFLA_c012G04784 [Penicillium flavigenum]